MSMPAHIQVAVVAATEAGLAVVKDSPALSRSGIAPRYTLVTLEHAKSSDTSSLAQLRPDTIGLWVALDHEAMHACEAIPAYSRGFYDHWLPHAVVFAGNRGQFDLVVAKVWDAFCATS